MKRAYSVLLLIGALVFCQAQLRNGGFEKTWNNIPTDWCEGTCCTCFSERAVTWPKVTGQYAMLIEKRSESWYGPSQEIGQGHGGRKYGFSASVQLGSSDGNAKSVLEIVLHFKRNGQDVYQLVGDVTAVSNQWKNIQGSYTFPQDVNGNVRLFIQSTYKTSPHYDFYVDDITMKRAGGQGTGTNNGNNNGSVKGTPNINSNWPRRTGNWRDEANAEIEKHRRRDMRIVLQNPPKGDFTLRIRQTNLGFPLGTAVSERLINEKKYRDTFFENFNYAVMENQMKWGYNEPNRNQVSYTHADQMMKILSDRGIPVRGHCVYWGVPQFVQGWVKGLSSSDMWSELARRAHDVVGHYKGQLTHWDLNNEMLHGRYFRDRLGDHVVPWMFQQARRWDPNVKLFLNDYTIITSDVNIEAFKQQAHWIQQSGGDVYGLGAQAHFNRGENTDYWTLRGRYDKLTNSGFPLWLTELDIQEWDENARAEKLEIVTRSAFSHPRVEGVLLWGYWSKAHWRGMEGCLWKDDWSISAAGRRWQELRREWTTDVTIKGSQMGQQGDGKLGASTRGFHGTYVVEVDGKKMGEFTLSAGSGTQVVNV